MPLDLRLPEENTLVLCLARAALPAARRCGRGISGVTLREGEGLTSKAGAAPFWGAGGAGRSGGAVNEVNGLGARSVAIKPVKYRPTHGPVDAGASVY